MPCVRHCLPALTGALILMLAQAAAHAHGVADGDKGYIQEISGTHLLPFSYLGALLVILLAGGAKATQDKDIKTALKLARML